MEYFLIFSNIVSYGGNFSAPFPQKYLKHNYLSLVFIGRYKASTRYHFLIKSIFSPDILIHYTWTPKITT